MEVLRISQLFIRALSARKQRGGLSLASLRELLLHNGYDVENKAYLNKVVKRLVSNRSLVRTKRGKNSTDSFTLSKRQSREQKEAATKTNLNRVSKAKKRKQ